MRTLQEFPQESQFVHQLQGRRVNSVPAKISQKICMFLEDHDVNAGASQEKAEHHPCRSTARDAASGF
jgi:hypothetical protein